MAGRVQPNADRGVDMCHSDPSKGREASIRNQIPADSDNQTHTREAEVAARLLIDGAWSSGAARTREDEAIAYLAQSEGILIEREKVQDAVDAYRARRGLQSSESTRRWLKETGLEIRQVAAHCRRELEREALLLVISSPQIEAWFQERQRDYDGALLSVISVATEPEAWLVHAAAQENPEEFDEIARSRIQPDAELPPGGALGWQLRRELPEELAAAVFAEEAPEVLAPMIIGGSFRVYRVRARRRAELTPAIEKLCRRDLLALRVSLVCHKSESYERLTQWGGFVQHHFLSEDQCVTLIQAMQEGNKLPARVYREDNKGSVAAEIRNTQTTTVPDDLERVIPTVARIRRSSN